ncbi:MAG: nitrogenase component 1 [Selenomonadaceae bacterium]|nr:nitrogenase component 1 [Selenomonadaceae bacterium]
MKGLRLYLPPFAPDDAGAASVFFPIDGAMVVICDAGGCAGNICGFDEPRWHLPSLRRAAVFSAGLRDMDAILGRDEKLIEKMKRAASAIHPRFAALIGTPVPAVIGTDFRALTRMAEKRLGLPCIAVPTNGIGLYDKGIGLAYLAMLKRFASAEKRPQSGHRILGVFGASPFDLPILEGRTLRRSLLALGFDTVRLYGIDRSLEDWQNVGENAENLVIAPSGLAAAKWAQERFGTPFTVRFPLLPNEEPAGGLPLNPKKILIVDQQFKANALRGSIRQMLPDTAITCGTFFQQIPDYAELQDRTFDSEEAFVAFVAAQQFDLILGDPIFRRALPDYQGAYLDSPHFAVNGSPARNNERTSKNEGYVL